MIDPVWFTIPGRVRGKGRPRATKVGRYIHIYTDAKTVAAENEIRHVAAIAMRGKKLLLGALRLNVTIWLHRPKSWSKRRRIENPIPTGKPDLDNVIKCLSDGMNGIVFKDDSQIAALSVQRLFISEDQPEQTEVMVGSFLAVAA